VPEPALCGVVVWIGAWVEPASPMLCVSAFKVARERELRPRITHMRRPNRLPKSTCRPLLRISPPVLAP
jgi:hypothetical protein